MLTASGIRGIDSDFSFGRIQVQDVKRDVFRPMGIHNKELPRFIDAGLAAQVATFDPDSLPARLRPRVAGGDRRAVEQMKSFTQHWATGRSSPSATGRDWPHASRPSKYGGRLRRLPLHPRNATEGGVDTAKDRALVKEQAAAQEQASFLEADAKLLEAPAAVRGLGRCPMGARGRRVCGAPAYALAATATALVMSSRRKDAPSWWSTSVFTPPDPELVRQMVPLLENADAVLKTRIGTRLIPRPARWQRR